MPRIRENQKMILYAALAITAVFLIFKFSYLAGDNESVRHFVSAYGYGGIFLISLVSGFNFLIPVPAISFLPLFLISGLNIWLAILFIILGTTLADIAAYGIGVMGRHVAKPRTNKYIFKRLEKLRTRFYWMPIFALFLFAAFVPFPNEIIVAPLGFLGYRFIQLLPALLLGNGVFNVLYALGIINLLKI